MTPRIGVASIVQETNTFSPAATTFAEFESQGIFVGEGARRFESVNTEAGGALAELGRRRAEPVPIIKTWAMSGGPITESALGQIADLLGSELARALPLDGLVLSLHGALVGETVDSGDLLLLERSRQVVGESCRIGVCLDLHANVTRALVDTSDFVIGYHTYPHVDLAQTGARTASLLLELVTGLKRPRTSLAKRPMLTAPEAQGEDGPFGTLRRVADTLTEGTVLDISLFPVQPWLDVPEVGFGVTVTTDGDEETGDRIATDLVELAWQQRDDFAVELVTPRTAIEHVRKHDRRPVLLSESADSPTAGATGDSPAMVRELLTHGKGLRSFLTLVDARAVQACFDAGEDQSLTLVVGASVDPRFHEPVELTAHVAKLGNGSYALTGPVFNGMEVTMGRYARLDTDGLSVLVTERPACTFDPETFRQAGLDPTQADIVVVRSANLFRAGWAQLSEDAIILDLPGASTPRFEALPYSRVPRPLFPLDE
jgi:microcystin degradation protein MlrC